MELFYCKNHPDLFWYCKPEAVSNGRYTGARHIYYHNNLSKDNPECPCKSDQLIHWGELDEGSF